MSHLNDLAIEATDCSDSWAVSGDRAAAERAMYAASALANHAARLASRLKDELEQADIRTVYDNDPHRSRS